MSSVIFDPQVFDDESQNTSKFNFKTSVNLDRSSSKVFYDVSYLNLTSI